MPPHGLSKGNEIAKQWQDKYKKGVENGERWARRASLKKFTPEQLKKQNQKGEIPSLSE